ncbi:MAG: carbamoyl phosphate synthase small subunit [Pseudonocardia sp.]|nr:carbamoyl phosphate synthase small subunit [Pseudonocardia sp.]
MTDVSNVLPLTTSTDDIAVMDLGAKWNILRSLQRRGVAPHVWDWDARPGEILERRPKGILVSNGPGDPAKLPTVVDTLRTLVGSGTPLMGICLGHQLLGLAAGGETNRLLYGHHGGNHPVRELASGRVTITTQNHEFQVVAGSIRPESGFEVSHINLNDASVEGLRHRELPVFSVQYHPEGCPGPQDSQGLFDAFLDLAQVERPASRVRHASPVTDVANASAPASRTSPPPSAEGAAG